MGVRACVRMRVRVRVYVCVCMSWYTCTTVLRTATVLVHCLDASLLAPAMPYFIERHQTHTCLDLIDLTYCLDLMYCLDLTYCLDGHPTLSRTCLDVLDHDSLAGDPQGVVRQAAEQVRVDELVARHHAEEVDQLLW